MILVSLATQHRVPPGTNAAMTRFHLPEAMIPRARGAATVKGAPR
jgi:hypothetical protein